MRRCVCVRVCRSLSQNDPGGARRSQPASDVPGRSKNPHCAAATPNRYAASACGAHSDQRGATLPSATRDAMRPAELEAEPVARRLSQPCSVLAMGQLVRPPSVGPLADRVVHDPSQDSAATPPSNLWRHEARRSPRPSAQVDSNLLIWFLVRAGCLGYRPSVKAVNLLCQRRGGRPSRRAIHNRAPGHAVDEGHLASEGRSRIAQEFRAPRYGAAGRASSCAPAACDPAVVAHPMSQ